MSNAPNFDQFPDRPNPYAIGSGSVPPPVGGRKSDLLIVPAIFLIVFAALSLLGATAQLVNVRLNGVNVPQNMPPEQAVGFQIGFWGSTIAILLFNLVVIAGAIAMTLRKNHSLAMAGAIAGSVPFCGPCLVLGMPFGIWALILLLRPDVKATFT